MKIKFQLVLKKIVQPEHYLSSKLFNLIKAHDNLDYDLETVKEWITIDYFTAYNDVPNRKLLGFTIEVPDTDGNGFRNLIDMPIQERYTSFAKSLQEDYDIVETVLRYYDDFILEELRKYQPQIFEIEMKLREVLNYILAYNLDENTMSNFLDKFEGARIADAKMSKEKDMQIKRYKFYLENELFHINFSQYASIHGDKQKNPKAEDLIQGILKAVSFEALKKEFYKIDFSKIEPKHAEFLDAIKGCISPVENLRNELMHNKKPTSDNITAYENVKTTFNNAINDFWENENNKNPARKEVIDYLLDSVFNENFSIDNENINFTDLNFEQKTEREEEFKPMISEQIQELLTTYEWSDENINSLDAQIKKRLNNAKEQQQ
jgi:hypothetical protein